MEYSTNIGLRIFRFIRDRLLHSATHQWYRGHLPIISDQDTNSCIAQAIKEGKPFLTSRLGSVEIKPTLYFSTLEHLSIRSKIKLFMSGDIDYVLNSNQYCDYMSHILRTNAGFFHNSREDLRHFSELYVKCINQIDLCGAWLNEYLLRDKFSANTKFCRLDALEPYDYEEPWSSALENKKVLVVHPFANSIKRQYEYRAKLWKSQKILPQFTLVTIKAFQTAAGANIDGISWFDALDKMRKQMDNIEYDVAIIGCGAYGLPLSAHAKETGHVAIHLGGPVQILFGIKGKRWDDIPSVSQYYNEYWVRPSLEETPLSNRLIENGCYW